MGIDVYIELGSKRAFACALDWPGWCRSGKDEAQAIATLAAYAPRYAIVAAEAGFPLPSLAAEPFDVVDHIAGSATTDFGAPAAIASEDEDLLDEPDADRIAALVSASWAIFDQVVSAAPAELRKGPRGGGRDRDKVVEHVLGAEAAYARKLGIRQRQPARDDRPGIADLRHAILRAIRAGAEALPGDTSWPVPYAARRVAWHVLDHAWEIQDRSDLTVR